jgi:CRP/FNR family cyclic AMP-dependent transcriptional regulator
VPADPELLSGIHLFQMMDDQERAAVGALMKEVVFPAGKTLFREGDPGGVLYVIKDGRLQLSVVDDTGKTVVVDTLEPGEFFGEISMLDGGKRTATAVAVEEVRALSLDREPFLALLRRQPDAALDVMTSIAKRMRKTDERLRETVRNANEVMEEQETFGERVADGVAKFGGSWSFIFSFASVLAIWVLINTIFVFTKNHEPFDPYPFILLNLFLSMLAAIQAPVIMMSQNRTDAKDRIRSELDYQVNVKAELEIMRLHEKVDALETRLLDKLDAR